MFGWAPFGWWPFSYIGDMTLPETVAVPPTGTILNYTLELFPSGGTPIYAAKFPFITRPGDLLANQLFEGRLKQGLRFEESIVDGSGFSGGSTSYGAIVLHNRDGHYDATFQNNTIDGRGFTLKYGWLVPPDQPATYDTYPVLLSGIALDWHLDLEELVLDIRDNAYKLEVPVCSGIYGGTGGADGTVDLAGKRKPRALGHLVPTGGLGGNVTPALIDSVNRIYQYNDGPSLSCPDVYDNGYALPGPSGDHASYAALVTAGASLTDGHFATCLAQSMFGLGAPPDGDITCDVLGDFSGTGYVNTTASIFRRIITLSAPLVDLVDEGTFNALALAQPAVVGIYFGLDDNRTVKQAGDELIRGISGWFNFRGSGHLEVGRLTPPAATAVDSFSEVDIVEGTLRKLNLPAGVNPPPKSVRFTYANNWTVQPNARAGVSAARREMLKLPHSIGQHSNTSLAATIAAAHPNNPDPEPFPAFFTTLADAVAEADRILSLYGSVTRSMYSFTDKSGRGFVRKIGETVTLIYDRFDLAAGKLVVIVGRAPNTTENYTVLTVVG